MLTPDRAQDLLLVLSSRFIPNSTCETISSTEAKTQVGHIQYKKLTCYTTSLIPKNLSFDELMEIPNFLAEQNIHLDLRSRAEIF